MWTEGSDVEDIPLLDEVIIQTIDLTFIFLSNY